MRSNPLLKRSVDIERSYERPQKFLHPGYVDRFIHPEYFFKVVEMASIFDFVMREDLKEYTEKFGNLYLPNRGETLELSTPSGTYIPEGIRKCIGSFNLPSTFISEFTNVTLTGEGAIVVTEGGQTILDTAKNSDLSLYKSYNGGQLLRDHMPYLSNRKKSRLSNGPYFLLAGRWSQSYFHWIVEYLPQLTLLKEYETATNTRPTLILSSSPPDWLTESLEMFGYDSDDWIEWNRDIASVDKLLLSPKTLYSVFPLISNIKNLRDKIQNDVSQMKGSKKVYVSREDAESRRVINEDSIMSEISDFGFEKYVLTKMTFREQVKLFAKAESIMGPSGAGLSNMIFSNASQVITIMGGKVNPCHFCLAEGLDIEFVGVNAEKEGLDMRVDPAKLVNILD